MDLFAAYLRSESRECARRGVALEVIGRRDRLATQLLEAIERAEAATRDGRALRLRIALDYSARDAIRRAAMMAAGRARRELTQAEFGELVAEVDHGEAIPPVDLVIRTGGERRLSDFLLWESAYAELFFLDTPWPEFTPRELAAVVAAFRRRERRFGGLPEAIPGLGLTTSPPPSGADECSRP
jgi:undecaprenyl diphosphate synthase